MESDGISVTYADLGRLNALWLHPLYLDGGLQSIRPSVPILYPATLDTSLTILQLRLYLMWIDSEMFKICLPSIDTFNNIILVKTMTQF